MHSSNLRPIFSLDHLSFVNAIKISCIIFVLAGTSAARAQGTVTNVSIPNTIAEQQTTTSGQAFFVYLSATITGSPTCATQTTRFAIDPDTPGGKAQVAAILAAQIAGRTINAVGRGVCDIWPGTESLDYVTIN
jgi:hypothetical protein